MIEKSSALIINKNCELLVVKKRSNDSHYILPGGKLDPFEKPEEALIREVKEELGVNVVDFKFVDTVIEKSQFEDVSLKMYLFETTISGMPIASSEISCIQWINILSYVPTEDLATGITKYAIPYLKSKYSENG
ncbi:MAG: NUDIX domain-containing protein [Streptococcus suis]